MHVPGDALTSLAVIGAVIWIALTGQTVADPILSGVIATVILVSAGRSLSEKGAILLQLSTRDLNYNRVIQEMESVPGVDGVHDVHIWSLSSSIFVLDAHVYSCERYVTRIKDINKEIKERLKGFRILHSTLEFECEDCTEAGSSGCILNRGALQDPSRHDNV
jgi:cobalt-zinc-cadmium efflux system protein